MSSRSPTAALKAPRASSTPQTPNTQQEPGASTTSFPPPQTFDIIPSLYALLVRHISAQQNQQAASDAAAGGPSGAETSLSVGNDAAGSASLDPKALITETSAVKIRLQKARATVEGLPDINRSVEEQEEEIAELEKKIERLRGVIGEFGRRSAKVLREGDGSR